MNIATHRNRNRLASLWLAVAAVLGLIASPQLIAGSIYEELKERDRYSTLVAAIDAAGLEDALSGDGSLTLFAPPNSAFAEIPEADLAALLEDTDTLTAILTYHVVGEELSYRDLESGPLATLQGGELDIDVRRFGWWWRVVNVDDARITRANISASNGVIHEINSVLDPNFTAQPSILDIVAAAPESFSTLGELVELAGLSGVLASDRYSWTVFAPTNAAFEAVPEATLQSLLDDRSLLRKVLLYHLVRGSVASADLEPGDVRTLARQDVRIELGEDEEGELTVMVNQANVIQADVPASNGTVHVIDSVLVPEIPKSLTTVIAERDELETLEAALGVTGQDEAFDSLRRYPSFTIFAPRNAAFDALPDGVLDTLLDDPEGLADVLGFHVVRGTVLSSQLRDGQHFRALNGGTLSVAIDDEGGVSINNATVVEADLRAQNGVVHIIDEVLTEDPFTIADLINSRSYLSTLGAALDATGLTAALDGPDQLTVFAPLNSAFDKLPEGTLEALLGDPEALSNILLFHVAAGRQTKSDLAETGGTDSLQGGRLDLEIDSVRFWWWRYDIITVNGVRVIATDLRTDNGVVHLITGVLLPPADPSGDEGEGG